MSSHALQQRLRNLARQARWIALSHGLATSLAWVLAAVALACVADYGLRFQDHGVRAIVSAGALAFCIWRIWRHLLPATRLSYSELQMARRVEDRFPQLSDQLSSTVAFLGQTADDPLAGSAEMRRAVVSKTVADTEDMNFSDCLSSRRMRRAVLVTSLLVAAGAVVAVVDPVSTGLAARRLVAPWSEESWPRRNQLEFVDPPARIAAGGDFEVELKDRTGRLPDVATIHLRYEGDEKELMREMRFVGNRLLARLNNVTRPFEYRASGGDDNTMDWFPLEVVQPPRVETMQVHITPPEYSGLSATVSDGEVEALVGSQARLVGVADRDIEKVMLRIAPQQRGADEAETAPIEVPGVVNADKRSFEIPEPKSELWTIKSSGDYTLIFSDNKGVTAGGQQQWEVRSIPDKPPIVSLESTTANRYVTQNALTPIKLVAEDDLTIRDVVLVFTRSDRSGMDPETLVLFQGNEKPPQLSAAAADWGEERTIDYAWDLAGIVGLKPGDWIEYSVAAHDYKPQEGVSGARRLTIVSANEMEDRIAQRRAFILGQLSEVLRVQRSARSQVKSLEIQLQETQRFSKRDVDQLQSSELNQRRVSQLLDNPTDGVRTLIRSLLEDLNNNRIDSPEVRRRMTELQVAIAEISKSDLPAIQRNLLNVLKDVRESLRDTNEEQGASVGEPTSQQLVAAGGGQDVVITKLENLLGELSQWDNYRRFAREVNRIQQTQEDIQNKTDDLRLDTLSKDLQDLTPQERAQLLRVSEQQLELARNFDKVQSRMKAMSGKLAESDPLAAETLADGAEAARQMAIAGQMRQSARSIASNQVGQASRRQEEISQGLKDLLDVLTNRRGQELQRKLRKLRQAAADLADLKAREEGLRSKLKQAEQQQDPQEKRRTLQRLSREQEQLAEEAARMARQLKRLQSQPPGDSLAGAAGQMQRSGQAGQQGDAAEAGRQAEQALQSLEQAQQQLNQQIKQTQRDLFQEQLARLEQAIEGVISRQQSILGITQELDQAKAPSGEFKREQLATIRDLTEQERQLARETTALSDDVAQSEAFQLSLRSAAREMGRAAGLLDREVTGQESQRAEQAALNRLIQLREALKPDPPAAGQPQPPQPQQPGQGAQPPQSDAIHALAELKLVKLMQEEINRRTIELEEVAEQPLSEEQRKEVDELAEEQGRLADIINKLIEAQQQASQEAAPEMTEKDGVDNELDKALDKALKDGL